MANDSDLRARTLVLAKHWGVVLPEDVTFSNALLALMTRLHEQQKNLIVQYQQVSEELNKVAANLRARQ